MKYQSPSAYGRFPRTTQEAFGAYARFDVPRPNRNGPAYVAVVVLIAIILAVLLTGCSPQYRQVSREVQEEYKFQQAWASDQARRAERGESK